MKTTLLIALFTTTAAFAGDYEVYYPSSVPALDYYYSSNIFKREAWEAARRERQEIIDSLQEQQAAIQAQQYEIERLQNQLDELR